MNHEEIEIKWAENEKGDWISNQTLCRGPVVFTGENHQKFEELVPKKSQKLPFKKQSFKILCKV